MNRMTQIPFWERYTMSVEEAAAYFRVGENKLQKLLAKIMMQITYCGTATDLKSNAKSLKSI